MNKFETELLAVLKSIDASLKELVVSKKPPKIHKQPKGFDWSSETGFGDEKK